MTKKKYKIDGTNLAFWAKDYATACQIVNDIGDGLLRWAKKNKVTDLGGNLNEYSLRQLLNTELGFERINPKTNRIMKD